MPSRDKLADFTAWCARNITGDEKGQAQIYLDRLFQAIGQPGSLDAGGKPEFRVRKATEDGGGTAFADYVWKPVVLIEMKKRGENRQKHYRQAFDYWTRLCPNRPRYVALCNFDESRVSLVSRSRGDETQTPSSKEKSETPHVVSYGDIKKIDAVAAAAREVRRVRAEALRNLKGGLRALYRTLELPGANPLKDAHAALDAAVLAAYGFSAKKDLLAQVIALNLEVAASIERGEPVTAPGVPPGYPEPEKLVAEGCIRPS